jgi:hypothetical protein
MPPELVGVDTMPGTTDDDSTDPSHPELNGGPQERTKGVSTPILTRDELFGLLESRRRRLLLWYLHEETDGEARLRSLSTQVAALEEGVDPSEVDPSARQRVQVMLYQSHLPKLVESGVVTYDEGRELVELTALSDVFVPYLAAEPNPFAAV